MEKEAPMIRGKPNRLLVLLLVLLPLLATSLTAAPQKTKVKVGCMNTITSVSPFIATNPFHMAVCGQVYMYLAQRPEFGSNKLEGVIAKSWKKVDDLTYNFTIYDYIYDTAGNHFTASDVAFCIEQSKKGGISGANYVKSFAKIDDYNFTLTLTTAAVGTFETVMESIYMVTQKSFEASPDGMATDPVGTTQYVCTKYVGGSEIILEKTDKFWQKKALTPKAYQANVDIIDFVYLTEITQMQLALMQDTIQMAIQVDNSLVPDFKDSKTLKTVAQPLGINRFLIFNMSEKGPFRDNLALRQAVCYAIDNESMKIGSAGGYAKIPGDVGIPSTIGYNSKWQKKDYFAYNPEKAKQLLAQAGYKPGQLSLTLMSNALTVVKSYFEVMASNLQAIGINAKVNAYESTIYGNYQRDVSQGMWDVTLGQTVFGPVYQINSWSYILDATLYKGKTQFGLVDDKLQAIIGKCKSPSWTQADMDALNNYVTDNCLVYQFLIEERYCVHNSNITKLFWGSKGQFCAGASTFSGSYQYH
jgi:peptide/nickel transport system substrate-binding protein